MPRLRCISLNICDGSIAIGGKPPPTFRTASSCSAFRLPGSIVYTLRKQLRQLNQLRDAEQCFAWRAFQVEGNVTTQRIG